MKKLFIAASICVSPLLAAAQLENGAVIKDLKLTDINGQSYDLYEYLAKGKTVYIDASTTWCGPCWRYHSSHALRELYGKHGPKKKLGVEAKTSNDVMVFFIESEADNTRDQLMGIQGNSPQQGTRGNWVEGVPYPIIDPPAEITNNINRDLNIAYFPTLYMVCSDKKVYNVGQLSADELYAKRNELCNSAR